MSFLEAILLGTIQGITEFLPISSSGHLVVLKNILRMEEPSVTFDVIVHFGTLLPILYFFRKNIKKLFLGLLKESKEKKRGEFTHLFKLLIIGTIPIMFVGFFLKDKIESIFYSLSFAGISFLITALLLFLTNIIKKREESLNKKKGKDAFFVGAFQALAILPGVSRSGSTIAAGFFRGLKKEDAFSFSFLLGAIAIFGANLLYIPQITDLNLGEIINGAIGFLFAAIFGFFALKILKIVILKSKLHYFGFYCFLLGIICLYFGLM